MRITVRPKIEELKRSIDDIRRKQIPFATALALNETAFAVRQAETDQLFKVFDLPTTFTSKAFRVAMATKAEPTAVVYSGDVQGQYLAPFIDGGDHFLGRKRKLIQPVNVKVNQYGNLPRNTLKGQLAKRNAFIGTITFRKSGKTVSGVWQRPDRGDRKAGGKGSKGDTWNSGNDIGARTGLTLLERFVGTKPVKQHLPFYEVGVATANKVFPKAFGAAFAKAIATAR